MGGFWIQGHTLTLLKNFTVTVVERITPFTCQWATGDPARPYLHRRSHVRGAEECVFLFSTHTPRGVCSVLPPHSPTPHPTPTSSSLFEPQTCNVGELKAEKCSLYRDSCWETMCTEPKPSPPAQPTEGPVGAQTVRTLQVTLQISHMDMRPFQTL